MIVRVCIFPRNRIKPVQTLVGKKKAQTLRAVTAINLRWQSTGNHSSIVSSTAIFIFGTLFILFRRDSIVNRLAPVRHLLLQPLPL